METRSYIHIRICILFKFNIRRSPRGSYDNVLNVLNLTPSSDRRLLLLSKCQRKPLSGAIDRPEMLSLIRFEINYLYIRIILYSMPFYPIYSNKNYILNSPRKPFDERE